MEKENNSRQERRKCRRIAASFIVMYKVNSSLFVRLRIGNKEINSISLDLSETGMAVLTNCNIPEGSLVGLRFILYNRVIKENAGRTKSMEVTGKVVYSLLTKEKAYRMGINFSGLSSEQKDFISKFIEGDKFNEK